MLRSAERDRPQVVNLKAERVEVVCVEKDLAIADMARQTLGAQSGAQPLGLRVVDAGCIPSPGFWTPAQARRDSREPELFWGSADIP